MNINKQINGFTMVDRHFALLKLAAKADKNNKLASKNNNQLGIAAKQQNEAA
ncbi:MAG: hypothetical protein QNJ70_11360 [Xenococcaceae cyanobacterium MO_207.B15]|nr:hypothetical protein [Xenococcaceae cyanobacterium MO_207.B15]MDJ0743815.1 hypothetical protein [Xenococcaceae cyanobacterium MO_167.B27]